MRRSSCEMIVTFAAAIMSGNRYLLPFAAAVISCGGYFLSSAAAVMSGGPYLLWFLVVIQLGIQLGIDSWDSDGHSVAANSWTFSLGIQLRHSVGNSVLAFSCGT